MQEAEQLHDEIDEILNEFFGDRPIPERTAKAKELISDERRYMCSADTVVSVLSPEVA